MPQLSHTIVGVGRKHASATFVDEILGRRRSGRCTSNAGGRGFYGEEPSRHLLGIVTRPCGSGS
jgi:hypothetical protein